MATDDATERIEGKVAHILNDREVIIDRGEIDGVELGKRFVILGVYETPNTRNPAALLKIDYPKTIVKIVRFQGEDHCVGRTFRTIKGTPARDSIFGMASALESIRATPDRVETLKTPTGVSVESGLGPGSRIVEVGDPVRETRGDEYLDDFV
jgi:hypothetical protein